MIVRQLRHGSRVYSRSRVRLQPRRFPNSPAHLRGLQQPACLFFFVHRISSRSRPIPGAPRGRWGCVLRARLGFGTCHCARACVPARPPLAESLQSIVRCCVASQTTAAPRVMRGSAGVGSRTRGVVSAAPAVEATAGYTSAAPRSCQRIPEQRAYRAESLMPRGTDHSAPNLPLSWR